MDILAEGVVLREKDSRFSTRRIKITRIRETCADVVSNGGFKSRIRLDRLLTAYSIVPESDFRPEAVQSSL